MNIIKYRQSKRPRADSSEVEPRLQLGTRSSKAGEGPGGSLLSAPWKLPGFVFRSPCLSLGSGFRVWEEGVGTSVPQRGPEPGRLKDMRHKGIKMPPCG